MHTEETKIKIREKRRLQNPPRPKGFKMSEEHKRKIGLAMKDRVNNYWLGRRHTQESIAKMSKAQKGLKKPPISLKEIERRRTAWLGNKINLGRKMPDHIKQELRKINNGKGNYNWKGDDVGYGGLHNWVYRNLGKPDTCEHCGNSGLKGRLINWANKSHEYKREITDWIRLCVPCHKKYDKVV